MSDARNVLGGLLQVCSVSPMTGFVRDGVCHTGLQDIGSHTVCVQMTEAFLNYSLQHGNDLISPAPEYDFPGLQSGDRWCMCAARWPGPADANFTPALLRESDGCKARRAGKGHPLPSGATPQTRFLAATRRDGPAKLKSGRAHPFVASCLQ